MQRLRFSSTAKAVRLQVCGKFCEDKTGRLHDASRKWIVRIAGFGLGHQRERVGCQGGG